jgi:hypothetical protein
MRDRSVALFLRSKQRQAVRLPTQLEFRLAKTLACVPDETSSTAQSKDLSVEELYFLACYHTLQTTHWLAVRFFLLTGDTRLAIAVYNQFFLGIRPRQLSDQPRNNLR